MEVSVESFSPTVTEDRFVTGSEVHHVTRFINRFVDLDEYGKHSGIGYEFNIFPECYTVVQTPDRQVVFAIRDMFCLKCMKCVLSFKRVHHFKTIKKNIINS